MKAKLFMILLAVLFIIPMSEAATEKKKRDAQFHRHAHQERLITRVPINYDIDVQDNESCLQIMFQFPLDDANITVTDKDGNTVVNESQVSTYEGKVFYIYTPNAYPYTVEITSPALDMMGEIVLEEN